MYSVSSVRGINNLLSPLNGWGDRAAYYGSCEILSWLAEEERSGIKQAQAEGIAEATK